MPLQLWEEFTTRLCKLVCVFVFLCVAVFVHAEWKVRLRASSIIMQKILNDGISQIPLRKM